MCGIAGQFLHSPHTPAAIGLQRIGFAMRYRGPDDEGIYCAPHIGLVHRRLSIRDLSPAGHCPMPSPDGLVRVLLNGEIYNWRELRSELSASGYSFTSESDSEVIVHGYQAWGEQLIGRLRGMFAIAVWDASRQRLLLARDRVGEKPLFYRTTETGLYFASTIEALALMQSDRNIDPTAIACYLAHSFIPATHTIWRTVHVLPPAHMLLISPSKLPELQRYWDFPRARPGRMDVKRCVDSIETVIEDSVTRCLDADVPVGVFLSGGVDSSLVSAMAARRQPGLPAFSLGFREEEFSELPHARAVAAHVGLSHHVLEVGVHDLIECLPHLVVQYGQPFGDASAVPSYLLARLARQKVTVCLSGDGGDESFGGYWRLQAGVYANRYARTVPQVVRRHFVPLIAPLLGDIGRRWLAMNSLSLASPQRAYSNSESWYGHLDELAGPNLRPGLAHDVVKCRTAGSEFRTEASLVQRILYQDFQVQLPDAYLTKVDVASMAASLEVRAPFLDQKVIEEAWVLPDRMKLHWGQRKWLLKRIASRWLPREIIYRPKMGFSLPLVHWWRKDLGAWLEVLMKDSVAEAEGWIQRDPVRRMLSLHRQGENHHTRLWLVLWLELWFRLVARCARSQGREDADGG
jgi:asparagine synthase (glutamine-hydrolysing)